MKLNIVRPSSCLFWFKEAIRLYRLRPMFFIGLTSLFVVSIVVSMMLGAAGVVLAGPLHILFLLSFMLAADFLQQGKTNLTVRDLFKTQYQGSLINIRLIALGGFYTLSVMVLVYLVWFFTPDSVRADIAVYEGVVYKTVLANAQSVELTAAQVSSIQNALLYLFVTSLLIISVVQAFFLFTPALVYWGQLKPAKAVFFNGVAVIKNLWPMVAYFVASFFLVVGGSFIAQMCSALALWLMGTNFIGTTLAFLLLFAISATMLSIINISIYIAFKAQFYQPRASDEGIYSEAT